MRTLKILKLSYLNPFPDKGLKHASKVIRTGLFSTAIVLLMLILASCSKEEDKVDPVKEGEKLEITEEVNVALPADSGEVGLVINTREIFRKSYTPTEAEVTFPDYPEFNEKLEIDPVTNVAILHISNEDLTAEQQNAFAVGVAITIGIYDGSQTLLTEYHHDNQVLDDSGDPLKLSTDLMYNMPPLTLKEGIPYYVQPQKISGDGEFPAGSVLMAFSPVLYTFQIPDPTTEDFRYDYYFTSVGDNAYHIQRGDPNAGPRWYLTDVLTHSTSENVIDVTEDKDKALEFVLEQDESGWVRIREAETNRYLTITEGTGSQDDTRKALRLVENTVDYFRLISSHIAWSGIDMGTVYQQPITPPAQLDFAYEATIRNCTPGVLTETVGNTETRVSTRSVSSTESLELFGSATATVGVEVGAEVGGSAGVYSASASLNISASLALSTSITKGTSKTLSGSQEESIEVSRSRSLEIPAFTGVEVYDAVRMVEGASVPFTQKLRITAQYKDGSPLSGDEIMTQMLFNFVTGVPTEIGDDYVDIGIGGQIKIANMYDVETGANELSGACD